MQFERIGNIVKIVSGGTPSRGLSEYWGGKIPWVKISDMISGYVDKTEEYITEEGLNNSATKILPKGTLLISIFATVGRTAILGLNASTNQAIVGLIPKSKDIDIQFLKYVLDSKIESLKYRSRGVAQNNINTSILSDIKIPFPSLEVQKQIADTLDKADALRQKRKQSIQLLDNYLKSVFYDMFGNLVKNEKGWEIKKLGEIILEKPNNGYFAKDFDYNNSGVPIIWISDFINKFYANVHNLKRVIINENDISKYKVDYGNVLFCRSSLTYEGIGKAGIIPQNLSEMIIFECHIIRLKFDINKIIPEFFRMLSDFHYFRKQIEKRSKTSTMTTISQEGITECNIYLPPLSLQTQFAKIVEQVEQTKSKMEESLKEIDNLFNSLMNKFFGK